MAHPVKSLPAMQKTQAILVRSLGGGRYPGSGNGNPFQYSCMKNPMDRGTWWATVQRVAESDTTEQLSTQGNKALPNCGGKTNKQKN